MKRSLPAAAALAIIGLAAFALMPRLDGATRKAVSEALGGLRSGLEGRLGLSLSFDSLSPSILHQASFSNLSISAPGGRSLLLARRARLRYDLLAFLRGRGSEALNGIDLDDVTIDIRLPEDEAVFERLSSLLAGSGAAGGSGEVSIPKIVISGKNVSASVRAEGLGSASLSAREVGFSTLEKDPSVVLDGRFAAEPSASGLGVVSGPIALSGFLSPDFRKARADLSIAADSRDFSLSTQRFELVYGDKELSLTKVKDRAPLDAAARLSFAGGESSVSLKMDGYSLSRSLKLSGILSSFAPWLEVPCKGSLVLRAKGTDPSTMSYEADISGSLPGRLLPGKREAARAELAAKGDAASVTIRKALLERGSERLSYAGSFRFADLAPDGLLDLRLDLMGGELPVEASARVFGEKGEYAALADQAIIGGAAFRDLALSAARKGDRADFNLSFRPPESPTPEEEAVELPASRFSGEAGASRGMPAVRCEGSLSLGKTPGIELSVDLESVDLGSLRSLLTTLTGSSETGLLLSSLKLGGGVFATSDFTRLSWSAPDVTLVSRSAPGAYALLSLSGTTTSVSVKRALVSFSGYSVEGSGKVDFADPGRLGFEAKLSLKDIPYEMRGSVAGEGLSIEGDYGLSVSARSANGSTYLSAKARGLPLPISGGLFLATVDAEGRFASAEDWSASITELSLLPTGESVSSLPRVELAGAFSPASAKLSSLRVEDKYSSLAGTGDLSYSLSSPLTARLRASLSSPLQKAQAIAESYKVDLSYSSGSCEGVVDFTASPLARLGKLPIAGSIDGSATISGDLADPRFGFDLRLRDGRLMGQSLLLSGSGSYAKGLVALKGAQAAYQGQSLSGLTLGLSLADASATFSAAFSGNLGGQAIRFGLSGSGVALPASGAAGGAASGAAAGESPKPGLGGLFANYSIKGALSDINFGARSVPSWPVALTIGPASLSLAGGSSGEVRASYAEGGVISASLRPPFPIRADASGLYDGRNIDLSVQGLELGLDLFAPFLPQESVRISAGKAHGGFRAVGLASDPEISGELDVEEAKVAVPGWITDEIGPFTAPIVAMGRRISVSVPSAAVGDGRVAIEGRATFDHWLPSGLTATARSIAGTTVRMDAKLMGIHAKGDAAVDLGLALRGDVVALDANLVLEKAVVTVSQEVLGSGGGGGPPSSAPVTTLEVTSNIRFGKSVQASFAPMSIPVVTGFADPSSSLSIHYDQAAENFSVKGTVALRGGEVIHGQRYFFLKNGKMVFNEGSGHFDPRVTLLAELHERNENGPVLITLKAENASISNFSPTISSDPALPESQLTAFLGFGSSGSSGDSSAVSFSAANVLMVGLEMIPQLNVMRTIGNTVRDFTGLDIFSVRSQVLQQWLVDVSNVSQAGKSTLGSYFDGSEIYAGKYIADVIFLHGALSLQATNTSQTTSGSQSSDLLAGVDKLRIDSEIGVDLDAPFGRLTWTLAPENGDWKNLKYSDQSLSLSWKLSY